MPRRTNPFQNLSASIMAVVHAPDYDVQESVMEFSKSGSPREIDIVITERMNQRNKILAECRDHARAQTVEWIESLYGKKHSLGYEKVLAISSSGFTKEALSEAKHKGIEVMTLREAEDLDWRQWLFSITEFGIVADFEPVVKNIDLQYLPGVQTPSLDGVAPKDIYIVNLGQNKKISLADYMIGLVKDPKVIQYVRANNTDNVTKLYRYEIPCDPDVGYMVGESDNFIQLVKIVAFLESGRLSQKVPLTHIRAGTHKMMVGPIDPSSRLVLEEHDGSLTVMIETRMKNKLTETGQ